MGWSWFFVGYLFGSFPTGYLIGKLYGKDVRRYGSGNIGTANVYRVLGKVAAALTAVGDVLKGFLPVFIAPAGLSTIAAAIGALLGSIFSVFLQLKGGKGFAALIGVVIALSNKYGLWWAFSILVVTWLTTLVYSRYSSLANLVAVNTMVPVFSLSGRAELLLFSIVADILIHYSHRDNIKRLLEGKEHRFNERVKEERW